MNKALLIGRVGKNPDIKHFDNGQIASFSLATTSRWKSKEGEKGAHRVAQHNRKRKTCRDSGKIHRQGHVAIH